jgi:hypothetical protein
MALRISAVAVQPMKIPSNMNGHTCAGPRRLAAFSLIH